MVLSLVTFTVTPPMLKHIASDSLLLTIRTDYQEVMTDSTFVGNGIFLFGGIVAKL